jgi:uncharacterized protein (TIGR02271 family)
MARITQTATVVGVFHDRQQALKAVEELKWAGFREDHIGVATRSEGEPALDRNTGSKAAEGAAIGAVTGAGIGVLWGIGVAAQVFPPLGIVAGGTLMALIASAGTGAGVATVIGALVGLGVPEDEAAYYEGEVKGGRTIVTVQADGRQDEAWAILSRCGAYNRSTAAAGGGQTVRAHEEQLHARKQPVQAGEVNVRKEVQTEHRTMDVPVQREEVVIDRHPASGQPASGADFRPGEEVRIPVKEEQVHVEKTPVVKEEVTVGKRKVQDT